MQGTVTKIYLRRLLGVSQLQNMVSQPTRNKRKEKETWIDFTKNKVKTIKY